MKPEVRYILICEIRERFDLDDRYNEKEIDMNLPYLFSLKNGSAQEWIEWIESTYNIEFKRIDITTNFFSSINNMVKLIKRYVFIE